MPLQIRDHSDVGPWSPRDGQHSTRPATIQLQRVLAQRLVGRSIVRLSSVAVAAGNGSKENTELQPLRFQSFAQQHDTCCLGAEDPVERIRSLILDELVLHNSGTVNDAIDAAKA